MKRFLAFALAFVMLLGLTACVPGSEESKTESQEESKNFEVSVETRTTEKLVIEGYSYVYSFPKIVFGDERTAQLNEDIYQSLYGKYSENVLDQIADGFTPTWEAMSYTWYVDGELLSILIRCEQIFGNADFIVFNVDLNTCSLASDAEVLAHFGVPQDEYLASGRHKAIMAATYEFLNHMWDSTDVGLTQAYVEAAKEEANARPLVGPEGKLNLCAALGSVAGPAVIRQVFPYGTEYDAATESFLKELEEALSWMAIECDVVNGYEIELDGKLYTLPKVVASTPNVSDFNAYIEEFYSDTMLSLNRSKYQPQEYINLLSDLSYNYYQVGRNLYLTVFKTIGENPYHVAAFSQIITFHYDLADGSFIKFFVEDGFSQYCGSTYYSLPKVTIEGVDTAAVNGSVNAAFKSDMETINNCAGDVSGYCPISQLEYRFGVRDDLLSLIIYKNFAEVDAQEITVFTLDMTSGKGLGKQETLSALGLTEEDYNRTAKNLLGSESVGPITSFLSEDHRTWTMEALGRTHSDEYLSLSKPVIGPDGQIYVFGKVGRAAGRGYDWVLLNYYDTPSDFYYSLVAKG